MRVVIEVRGGMVQTVYGTDIDCEVDVYDFDAPFCSAEDEYECYDLMSEKHQHEIENIVRLW